MHLHKLAFAILVLTFSETTPSEDDNVLTLEKAPPVVVKTIPEAGSNNVDPALTDIRVTFSKRMRRQSMSWVVYKKEAYHPVIEGIPEFTEDQRSCVAKVKLQPNRTYAVLINSKQYDNFKDVEGRSAMPYLLVFRTGRQK
jgi:RNA polymerase sigma-70 factor (ECF subfamily)